MEPHDDLRALRTRRILGIVFRWIAAAGLLRIASQLIAKAETNYAPTPEDLGFKVEMMFPILFAIGALLIGIALIAPEVVRFLLRPVYHWIEGLYGSGDHSAKPPLDYRLARLYVRQGKLDSAAELYERILRYYPEEPDAYRELLEVYAYDPASPKHVKKLIAKARKHGSKMGGEQFDLIERMGERALSAAEEAARAEHE